MKANLIGTTLLLAAAAGAGNVMAANPNAVLNVKGVIRPGSCQPAILSGGRVDFGDISQKSLHATDPTALKFVEVGFSIACQGAVSMGVTTTDNKAQTKVDNLSLKVDGAHENAMYGLGKSSAGNIGAFHLGVADVKADGKPIDVISRDKSAASTAPWTKDTTGLRNDRSVAWAATGSATPGKYQLITGTLKITPVIAGKSSLPLTGDINLDGMATLELSYL